MKIPYRWIREYVDVDLTAAQAADRLINAGVEVASVAPTTPDLGGVVVGEIEAIERELGAYHAPASRRPAAPPDPSHRLLLCRVSTGRERRCIPSLALSVGVDGGDGERPLCPARSHAAPRLSTSVFRRRPGAVDDENVHLTAP